MGIPLRREMMNKNFALCLTTMLIAAPAFASEEIQTEIRSHNGYSRALPKDGSACDPTVIAANLKKLRGANVLNATNLTRTEPGMAHGNCYGPCPQDVEDALERHCAKAEKLAEIAQLLQ